MRLSQLLRPRNLPLQLIAAGLLAVLLASPVTAEPSNHATTAEADTSEPANLAGPQSSQPQPVYPDGDPEIETVDSDAEPEEAPQPKVVVTIDKGIQEMTVWVDGIEKYTWPVSTGIGGYSTPSGTYTASSMNKIWYSKQWDNAPMPHAIFFTKRGHAIHGTNEVKRLGNPASHGCVRLSPKNAGTLFKLVEEKGLKNTQVVLTGVTPGGEYKVSEPPRQRTYPAYPGDRYGRYYEEQPPGSRKRRRLFQPYYQAPPPKYQPQPQQRRRGWFFRR
jgi:lipoprotein-anchoring transpeptidase ErfK/SrfK